RNVGQVALALREAFDTTQSTVDLRSFSLLGDPATNVILPAPKAPTTLHVTTTGDHQVSLAWTASAEASTYRIYRSVDDPSGSYSLAGSTAATTFTDTGLINCKSYYYRVVSVDAGGFEGPISNANSTCPAAGDCVMGIPRKATAPSAPTGLTLTDRETGDRMN